MIQHKICRITNKTDIITSQRSFSVFSLPERKIRSKRTEMCGKKRIQKWDLFLTGPSLLVDFVVDLWEVASAAKFVAHLGNNSLVQTFGFATFGGILEKKGKIKYVDNIELEEGFWKYNYSGEMKYVDNIGLEEGFWRKNGIIKYVDDIGLEERWREMSPFSPDEAQAWW